MTSQTRIKTQERRSNSFSALKKSNYDQDNQDFSIVTSQIQANTNKSSKFASLKDMGNKPNSTFVTSRTTIDKKPTHNGLSCIPTVSSSAANSLTFKDQQQQQKQSILEPINETPEDKLEKLLSSLSGKLTETDIQEMLLSYTYTSGEIDDKLISNIISNANYRKKKEPNSIKIKFKSVWSHTIFTTIDVAERIEEKMFELFWVLIVNLDLWFPKIASVVRTSIKERVKTSISSSSNSSSITRIRDLNNWLGIQLSIIFKKLQEKPFLTLFISSVLIGVLPPVLLFLIMLFSISTLYFFIYLTLFIVISFFASFFIIPLLSISFVFASGVVVFGFFSNITFKLAQTIYINVDKKLKFALTSMSIYKPTTTSSTSQSTNDLKSSIIMKPFNLKKDKISPIEDNINIKDNTSAIARSLEAHDDIRVTL